MRTMRIPALDRALAEILLQADEPEIVNLTIEELLKIIFKQQETIEGLRKKK